MSEVKYPENYLTILHKQIDLLQDNIKRMNNNSFLIKAWTIGLLALCLGFIKDFKAISILFLIVPILFLWFIDGCFLYYEYQFRDKYNELTEFNTQSTNTNNFDVIKLSKFYNITPKSTNKADEIIDKMLSTTLIAFYGCHILFIGILFLTKGCCFV
ncbi:MAG: hypothetical protein K2Y14_03330 [Burkholderiales bacterium]|nr:hypothetical protein [Burkholderiales bacterium]